MEEKNTQEQERDYALTPKTSTLQAILTFAAQATQLVNTTPAQTYPTNNLPS
ncbi:MAG: hypothetical protein MJZ98_04095 [Paludibacteraceae bacterium]|nr:hypothetical protein [Paludibacteraceae bacterium]